MERALRSQSSKSEGQKEKGSRAPWPEEKQGNKAGVHSARSLSGCWQLKQGPVHVCKLGRRHRQELRAEEPAVRLERCFPRLAGKARSSLTLPTRTGPGRPVGPPAQAPPPRPRPSSRCRPQRQQGTPNTNLNPASKESAQPWLLKEKKNVPSVRTQQEPRLTASSPAWLTFLIWRIRQAHTEARRWLGGSWAGGRP